jgi:hypothetical protein
MIFAEIGQPLNGHEGHVPLEVMGGIENCGGGGGVVELGNGAVVLSPLRRKRPSGHHGRCATAQPLGVLAKGGLQFAENLPGLVGAFGGDRFSTKFTDAIIEAASAPIHHNKKTGFQDEWDSF